MEKRNFSFGKWLGYIVFDVNAERNIDNGLEAF
jgi:hypothetical protein